MSEECLNFYLLDHMKTRKVPFILLGQENKVEYSDAWKPRNSRFPSVNVPTSKHEDCPIMGECNCGRVFF